YAKGALNYTDSAGDSVLDSILTPREIFFFFFSSRRRHTRWPRDWSSDVCSSDLVALREVLVHRDDVHALAAERVEIGRERRHQRSEERRVGKECRARWWPHRLKKKIVVSWDLCDGCVGLW